MRENRIVENGFDLIIEPLRREDIAAILRIEAASDLAPSPIISYEKCLSDDNAFVEVARLNREIAGFVEMRLITSVLEIVNIAVLPEFRRCGIGHKLLRSVLEVAARERVEEIWLEVRESNETAIRFYEAHNFQTTGKRRKYYSAPIEDAALMNLKIAETSE